MSRFVLVPDVETPLAFVTVSPDGEPTYHLRGGQHGLVVTALGDGLDAAVDAAAGLFISTNTLVGADERALTMRARERMLARGGPVMFDANLRLHRWGSRTDASASANACVHGALLVRANRAEAELMTGESDPEWAAMALVKAGARLVVLTLGDEGAILRGALSGFYESSVAASLPEAIEAAARACERWGAVD